jgi:hypothetical protein
MVATPSRDGGAFVSFVSAAIPCCFSDALLTAGVPPFALDSRLHPGVAYRKCYRKHCDHEAHGKLQKEGVSLGKQGRR